MRAGIAVALWLAACGAPSREAPPPAGPARYAGRLPGPDGTDRVARLHLGDDGRYLLTTGPIDAPGRPFRAEGFYAWAGDTLWLDPQDADGTRLLRVGNALHAWTGQAFGDAVLHALPSGSPPTAPSRSTP
jgi:hypothetical protein